MRGKSMEIEFKNEEIIETVINYYNSGQKKNIYSYINGELNGNYIVYHENGKVYVVPMNNFDELQYLQIFI